MRLKREYENQPFSSIEDMSSRTLVNSSNIETMREHGVFNGLSEPDQLTLFSMM